MSFIAGSDPQEPSDALGSADDNPPSSIIGFAPDGTPILAAAAGQDDNFPRRPSGFPVQLEDEEGDQGAHTMRDHVGKSPEYLVRRLQAEQPTKEITGIRYLEAVGSFTSLRAANRLVNATLSEPENAEKIAATASGLERGFMRIESNTPYSSPTGSEAFRSSPTAQPYIRDTNAVRVIIVHDPTLTRGYRIFSAFPIVKKNFP